MRIPIEELVALGALPAAQDATVDQLQRFEAALKGVVAPVTQNEALALAKLFGPDDCFGLAWSLVHLIETAPELPMVLEEADGLNIWISSMRERVARGG